MADPIDIARARRWRAAEAAVDCRLLTVEDVVVDFLESIRELPEEERPTQLVLIARRHNPDDGYDTWTRVAGITLGDRIEMLERDKVEAIIDSMQRAGDL